MIPAELTPSTIELTPTEQFPIVIFTGGEIRHERFALRLQAEFPDQVVAWFRVEPAQSGQSSGRGSSVAKRMFSAASRLPTKLGSRADRDHLRKRTARLMRRFARRVWRKSAPTSQRQVETLLFGLELERLKRTAYCAPETVHNPNAPEIIARVRQLAPYFILTLGGSFYGKELRDCAQGLALNQHDGWCPQYRGSNTVDWALYHRDLSRVANTIHILTDGMDSGPILRRSIACLADDDTAESCFARSVALGTELMCETVHELIQSGTATIFPQPKFDGHTYLHSHLTEDVATAIRRDIQTGLVANDIAKRKTF